MLELLLLPLFRTPSSIEALADEQLLYLVSGKELDIDRLSNLSPLGIVGIELWANESFSLLWTNPIDANPLVPQPWH
jgi:hypothetical protein